MIRGPCCVLPKSQLRITEHASRTLNPCFGAMTNNAAATRQQVGELADQIVVPAGEEGSLNIFANGSRAT